MTLAQILTAIETAIDTDAVYTSEISGNDLTATAAFTGVMNPLTINVNAGQNADGSTADFALARTVLNDGQGSTTVEGSAATYIILLDTTQVATGTFASNVSASAAATVLSNALVAVEAYSGSVNGDVLRATSSVPAVSPDITITITPGADPDGTAGTLAVSKAVVQQGEAPTISYATTIWTYYVINQEVRVDDDTTEMDDNNNIMVRRGLLNDVQTWDDISQTAGPNMEPADINIAYLTETFTSGARASQAIVTLNNNTTQEFTSGAAANINMNYRLQTSTDNGMTWVDAVNSYRLPIRTQSGLVFTSVTPIVFSEMFALTPSTEYRLRVIRRFTADDGTEVAFTPTQNFLVNMLLLEELITT